MIDHNLCMVIRWFGWTNTWNRTRPGYTSGSTSMIVLTRWLQGTGQWVPSTSFSYSRKTPASSWWVWWILCRILRLNSFFPPPGWHIYSRKEMWTLNVSCVHTHISKRVNERAIEVCGLNLYEAKRTWRSSRRNDPKEIAWAWVGLDQVYDVATPFSKGWCYQGVRAPVYMTSKHLQDSLNTSFSLILKS